MKIRSSFVSNSSSSSFLIYKFYLSEHQINLIKNNIYIDENNNVVPYEDRWNIEETEHTIKGSTYMDNYNFREYLEYVVRVDMNHVKWADY